ncbi:2-dehydropantoate 2-reductase [Telmatospirillum siberiense]|uniref:2-dehydropantoate 2-reductase n=1 Tax=Telmatospirillum siberiense TaxID=382514 RepID=A0A2N3PPY1_9PROT|nr:2-dehydropantoate 2-reductase [Telmatospirillum siberiense]PKU22444.1 2-dehydropantoate 2-reductase [Telmatospirillum siberiense]
MRVLVVGAGAIGGYFGGRLLEAGIDVTFLVRPRRAAQLAADGLVVTSPHGDIALPARTVLAEALTAPWDLVLLGCKAYDLAAAMESVAPAVGPETMILPLLNGMRHLDSLDERFGAGHVLGGLCAIAATLDEAGVVRHLNDIHLLAFGERDGSESARIKAVADVFSRARAQWRSSRQIVQEMWEKWVFLSTLAASTCLLRASVGDIVMAGGVDTLGGLLAEAQSIAEAEGYGSRPDILDKARTQLTAAGSSLSASMMRDVEKGGPVEADHVIGDLLRRAQAAGLGVPLLKLAHLHLKAYEARRQRESVRR